ncbi:MAG: peptidoglycan DD-metalloendopeptidase family protein [Clostridia bacterium]
MKKEVYEKKGFKVIVLSFISILMITGLLNVYGEAIDDYQKDLDNLRRQQKEVVDKLSGVEKEIAEDIYDIMSLDSKVTKYTTEANELQKKVDTVNVRLSDHQNALQNSSKAYEQAELEYGKRVRSIYENGMPNMWDILLTSRGISDFFRRVNVYTSILNYDKELVGNIKSKKEYIDYIKKDVEIQKLQLDQLKKDTEKVAATLNDARAAKETKVQGLKTSKENLEARVVALDRQKEDANKKIDEQIDKIRKDIIAKAQAAASSGDPSNITTFAGGQFAWPVPGYNVITTRFNIGYDPWGSGKVTTHTGCDVAGGGIYGKPIVAMQDGVITLARYNGGYGNCVMINHGVSAEDGNLYVSLYGHASALNVTQGQIVKKGDVIAYIGSTGNSTGPHLHLELSVGKPDVSGKMQRVNALDYFPGMNFIYL